MPALPPAVLRVMAMLGLPPAVLRVMLRPDRNAGCGLARAVRRGGGKSRLLPEESVGRASTSL